MKSHTFEELLDAKPQFVAAVKAQQIEANKGWETPPSDIVDRRVFECPVCGSPGLNTCFGYVAFSCGSEWMPDSDDDWSESEPCNAELAGAKE